MASILGQTNLSVLAKVLTFSAIVEICTGLALEAAPTNVVSLLLGADDSNELLTADSRLLGIALMSLGLACWPGGLAGSPATFLGMLLYNALIALSLAYLGTVGHLHGLLLWPAVGLHAAVALSLLWNWRAR
jgi:hypothetical protein